MAADRVFSAPEHKDLITSLSRRLNFAGGGKDYIIGRIAIARSLIFNEIDYDNLSLRTGTGGKEYHRRALLGDELKDSMFKALITQRHQHSFESDDEFMKAVKFHLDRGLDLIANEIENRDIWDYLTDLLKSGIQGSNIRNQPNEIGFGNILKLVFGKELTLNKQIEIEFNRRQNTHLGIAGGTGSGKTQFILDLICQLRNNSKENVNVIFIDYKGDVSKNESFVRGANLEVVDVSKKPLPFNPFWIPDTKDEKSVKRETKQFEEMIAGIEKRIGPIQKSAIYDAILNAFQKFKDSKEILPDVYDIKDSLEEIYSSQGKQYDTASEIFNDITKLEIFPRKTDKNILQTLYNHSLVFDISSIKSQKNLIVFFILEYIRRELIELDEQNMYGDIRELKTVIVIDEAHYFLRDKKMCSILEEMLRTIRSKGVSVFLLTQSPDDFSVTEDFLLNLEFIVVLNSKIDSIKFLQKAFSIVPQRAKDLIANIGNLKTGEGYIKCFETGKPIKLELNQFWKRP